MCPQVSCFQISILLITAVLQNHGSKCAVNADGLGYDFDIDLQYKFCLYTMALFKAPTGSLIELFGAMKWDGDSEQWDEEADLRDAIRYARGSKLLKIPPGWRDVLPTTIPPAR